MKIEFFSRVHLLGAQHGHKFATMMKPQANFSPRLFHVDLYPSSQRKSFIVWPKCKFMLQSFTANFLAFVQSVTAVVLPVTEPLFGNALVFRAGELIPKAWWIYKGKVWTLKTNSRETVMTIKETVQTKITILASLMLFWTTLTLVLVHRTQNMMLWKRSRCSFPNRMGRQAVNSIQIY